MGPTAVDPQRAKKLANRFTCLLAAIDLQLLVKAAKPAYLVGYCF
jgi:hypothetical protein